MSGDKAMVAEAEAIDSIMLLSLRCMQFYRFDNIIIRLKLERQINHVVMPIDYLTNSKNLVS
jgi:hypothetical protein